MGNSCANPDRAKRQPKYTSTTMCRTVGLSEFPQPSPRQANIGVYFIKQTSTKNVLETREKWTRLLSHFVSAPCPFSACMSSAKHSGKFLKLAKKGPPTEYRWQTWKAMVRLNEKMDVESYKDLPYGSFSTMTAINRDLDRTFPNEPYFDKEHHGHCGQKTLERMLGRLAGKYHELGYCQSLNFLGGFLLLINGGSDVEAFYMLETLLEEYQLRGFYTEEMSYLKRTMWVFDQIFTKRHPKLAEYFAEIDLVPEMWVMQWFMTLFTTTLGFDVVARIWDIFLVDRIAILYQVALAIVGRFEKELLGMDTATICDLFKRLKDYIHSPDTLINDARKIDISYLEVKQMERQHEQSTSLEAPKVSEEKYVQTIEIKSSSPVVDQIIDGGFYKTEMLSPKMSRRNRIFHTQLHRKKVDLSEEQNYSDEESAVNINQILDELENKDSQTAGMESVINFINNLDS